MSQQHAQHHIASPQLYIGVFLALMALTALTVWVATVDLGFFNTIVALAIAIVKAGLVILFFMHLLHSPPQTKLFWVAAAFWVIVMIVLAIGDYGSRDWQWKKMEGWENIR